MPGWRRDGDFYTSWQPQPLGDDENNKVVPYQEPSKPSRRAFLERQIQDFIKQRPEDVAEVIKRWLREDQE
ncbi:MAG: hypothetical protein FJZ00_03050 [Candidatus Sericytochromatia bacterium]|uniref:Uncharacterized protein n=1 Tax=Candidatus Tanganyikabacteria bacterium TaxID=2961651 RepID=A0A937X4A5_9BACT|nr:hypothetical protein [Candidatus Tanganyikabacteria bacterium]